MLSQIGVAILLRGVRSNPAAMRQLIKVPSLPSRGFSAKAAETYVAGLGLPAAERPLGDDGGPLVPELPYDLDEATIGQLVTLMGQFTKLSGWLEEQVALTDSDSTEADIVSLNVGARQRLKVAGTVQDKNAKVAVDESFLQAQADEPRTADWLTREEKAWRNDKSF